MRRAAMDLPCLFVIKENMVKWCQRVSGYSRAYCLRDLTCLSRATVIFRRDLLPLFQEIGVKEEARGSVIGKKGRNLQNIVIACRGGVMIVPTREGFGIAAADRRRLNLAAEMIEKRHRPREWNMSHPF